ncbi:MAG: hypothetical protein AseanaTS_12420 [Candidatus Pelagadaptatus aseana]|uniref:hypothetical protein n=1 Tax=Candidatus Pelagadaptatus aseana TaxID=3120508 RepID=UPI0039B1C5BE
MLEVDQALALAAKEIRVQRYKQQVWQQACRLAELNNQNREAVYARLRVLQLTRGISCPAESLVATADVLAGLRHRTEQCLWEGGVLVSSVMVVLLGVLRF